MNNALADGRLQLIHELPRRLRFKLPWLEHPRLDTAYMQAYLDAQPGVKRSRINRWAASVIVEYDGRPQARAALIDTLTRLDPAHLPQETATAGAGRQDGFGMAGKTLITLLLPFLPRPAQAVLAYLSISDTLLKGLGTLIDKGIKVEVLDAIAVGLSAARGEYLTANLTHWLLAMGEFMEEETSRESQALIASLLKPAGGKVWVERNGRWAQVDSGEIQRGEVVVLGPGDTIPVDGVLLEGTALLNQASLTGESAPVRREPGTRLLAGTLLEDGNIKLCAEQVGDQTTTARINRFILESLQQRSTTQQVTAEMANRRVLITLSAGALVFVLTRRLSRLAAVFLVDYSCALKLSTPVSFKAGMYRAAKGGVLFKGGKAIEELAAVDTIIFDKTGTLSHGELEVTDVLSVQPGRYAERLLLAAAASVEEHATHPIAAAVVRAARRQALGHIPHGEVEYIVAHGLRTVMADAPVLIGSRHYLEAHEGVDFSAHEAPIAALEKEGKLLLYAAHGAELVGIIALRDRLRQEAGQVLRRLRTAGIKTLVLLTGDRKPKALALARQLHLDAVYAEMTPEDKAGVVRELQQQGRRVAFVGDGVNDAPALAAADVGISMPRGADITRHMADVVLLEDRLDGIGLAREMALDTMALIRSNITLAEVINSGVMLGAAFGWLSPIATALLHNGTTLGILLRSLGGLAVPTPPEAPARSPTAPEPAAGPEANTETAPAPWPGG